MRKFLYYIEVIIILTIFWIIINEKITPIQIIVGIFLGFLAVIFTEKYLLLGDYKHTYIISPKILIKYLIYLFIEIYMSGFTAIYRILSHKVNVGVIEYESNLDNDFLVCILANSITLTPGTVTIDKKGKKLKILCLSCPEDGKNSLQASVRAKFENILKGGN
ncbi:MAG: Na+/H+ antiporter subunit E [Firmicutes bacterium]|nr:Na+/H+ antiporter subunit E [Bacillota bacterium]